MNAQRPGLTPPTLSRVLTLILAVAMLAVPAAVQAQPRDAKDDKPQLLTDEQINLIHVYEVDLNAKQDPRITIPNETLRDFMSKYQSDERVPRGTRQQNAFLKADGRKQLRLLFDLQAREFYKDVRVRGRIASMSEWSTQHRRYVVPYFREHFGKGQIEGFKLMPRGADGKRIEMTNFYILTQTTIGGKRMIDRNTPEDSLLLQWGLPRDQAKFPAPQVDGWRPQFKDTKDDRYVKLVNWIKMLYPSNQDKDYDITYSPIAMEGEKSGKE